MRVLIFSFSAFCAFGQTDTPKAKEFFRQAETQRQYHIAQIAALQLYLGNLRKGYSLAKAGLSIIGKMQGDEFDLHRDFITSLGEVSGFVSSDRRIAKIVSTELKLQRLLAELRARSSTHAQLTDSENGNVESVCSFLTRSSTETLSFLTTLTQPEKLDMTSAERVSWLATLHRESTDRYEFAALFSITVLHLASARSADDEKNEQQKKYYE